MPLQTFPIKLEKVYWLTPNVKHFTFRSDHSPAFEYTPGQFITIHFEHDDRILRRSYSIANVPQKDNQIEFAAGYVEGGPGTNLLFNLEPGDSINITGPFGRLILKENKASRYVLVATSTGVTPYRAMLEELSKRIDENPQLQVVIMQGVQKRTDVLYSDEFQAFARKHPHAVTFSTHLSRENSESLLEHEQKGYVQHAFPNLTLNPEQDIIYLCGNPGMIDESFTYLKEQGFSLQSIIREKYISAK